MKNGDTFFRAWVETRAFYFEGFGTTQEAAKKACYRAWLRHVKECQAQNPKAFVDRGCVTLSDISADECVMGESYRDRERINR